jgi:hypothetical protein
MTVAEVAQLITSIATLIGVLRGMSISRGNAKKIEAQVDTIKKLEINTNSIKDALILATAKASHAEGLAEGKAAKSVV